MLGKLMDIYSPNWNGVAVESSCVSGQFMNIMMNIDPNDNVQAKKLNNFWKGKRQMEINFFQ